MIINQPSAPTNSSAFHAVRFYKDSDSLCRLVATFLVEGFAEALPAIVIATSVHRAGILESTACSGHRRRESSVGWRSDSVGL